MNLFFEENEEEEREDIMVPSANSQNLLVTKGTDKQLYDIYRS